MTRPIGRPSKLNDETKKRLFDAVKQCNTLEVSCSQAGISYRTMRNWEERGRREKSGEYFHFFQALRQAKAEAEAQLVGIITRATEKDWKAAVYLLERRNPKDWGKSGWSDACTHALLDDWHKDEMEGDREFLNRLGQTPEGREALLVLSRIGLDIESDEGEKDHNRN